MTAITQADYAAMSWHARQRLNDRLRAETRELRAKVARIRALGAMRRDDSWLDPEVNYAEAIAILNQLPDDPAAASHRVALDRELAGRTGGWR